MTPACFFFLGPERWHETYPLAKGSNQSPVAILTKDAYKDPVLLPWFTGYDPGAAKNIANTGKTCRITFDDTFDRSVYKVLAFAMRLFLAVLRGGPLQSIYRLRSLNIHWGSTNDKGSEHVVDATRYAGEVSICTVADSVGALVSKV
ncbi:hypothetical protein lerEdw1_013562 [Lerista edwardsae]|nr:hypothetical protein lerEdw1_013563 [Lerista edwardsae]KAJ6644778.1 hypothetical protein lerEdw1_013562 [Lerista edwardsae]